MKIHFTELEAAGYSRHGNWRMKNDISVNLISNTIRHAGKPSFDFFMQGIDVSVADIDQLGEVLAKFTKPTKKQSVNFEVADNWR